MKFEPHAGHECRTKLGESVKEIEDGCFELALGAVKNGVDDFLTPEFPQTFNQVQIR